MTLGRLACATLSQFVANPPAFVAIYHSSIIGIIDSARKSLFFYQPGESWDTFYNPYFIPSYQPTFGDPDIELQAREICGDDEFCLFDVAATGRVDVGVSTLESSDVIEEIYSFLIPGESTTEQQGKNVDMFFSLKSCAILRVTMELVLLMIHASVHKDTLALHALI